MSLDNDDFFGGFFDFNGDGITDPGEQWVAYKILEDIDKDANEEDDDESLFSWRRNHSSAPHKIESIIPDEVPYIKSHEEFKRYKTDCIISLICLVFAGIFMLVPFGLLIWASLETYDSNNSASDFLLTVFVIAELIVTCFIMYKLPSEFHKFREHIRIIQENSDSQK